MSKSDKCFFLPKSDKCFLCQKETESVRHMFGQSQRVQELWNNLETWILNELAISIKLNKCMKILGYTILDHNFWQLNVIVLFPPKIDKTEI